MIGVNFSTILYRTKKKLSAATGTIDDGGKEPIRSSCADIGTQLLEGHHRSCTVPTVTEDVGTDG